MGGPAAAEPEHCGPGGALLEGLQAKVRVLQEPAAETDTRAKQAGDQGETRLYIRGLVPGTESGQEHGSAQDEALDRV